MLDEMKFTIKLFVFCFLLLIYSCATIVMPSGGPKDTTPPEIIKTYPENKSVNFSDNKIVLYFNEFVELNTPQTNVSVSPYSIIKPKTNVIGKKVVLNFEEGLKQNTTYTIDFNNAIKDFNEGNLISNYRLTFSTGPRLDSGKLMVAVNDAKTGLSSDMTKVCLVKNKSDFFGKNYKYVANASNGLSDFSSLTQEPFYVYAFVDSNMNMIWEKTEAIGFLNEPHKAGTNHKIKLFQQSQKKTNFFITPISTTEYDITSSEDVYFPQLLDSENELIKLSPRHFKLIVKTGISAQSLRIRHGLDKYETLELAANKPSKYIEKLSKIESRSTELVSADTVKIHFNALITKIDTERIKLKSKALNNKSQFSIHKNKLLILGLDLGQEYQLIIDSQAIYSAARYNLPLTQTITTFPKEKYYKELTITLDPNLASNKKAKLFQIIDNEWIPIAKEAKLKLNNVYGDELKFDILIDTNNDGLWTTGDIEKDIQPEQLYRETIKLEPKKTDYLLKITSP